MRDQLPASSGEGLVMNSSMQSAQIGITPSEKKIDLEGA